MASFLKKKKNSILILNISLYVPLDGAETQLNTGRKPELEI